MKPFDILRAPLKGYNLIEASAGTGKTHAIADLFLRLILEKGLPVSEILVVTFTEAATGELRDRIRKRLKKVLDVLTAEKQNDEHDALLVQMIAAHRGNSTVISRLREALRNFDEAAIYTIHGFCQRMLQDKPFESNSLFDTELVTDQAELLQEVADDFWRRNFYMSSPQFIQYAIQEKCSPGMFLRLLRRRTADPEFTIIPVLDRQDINRVQDALQETFDRLRSSWPGARPEVEELFRNSTALSRVNYKTDSIAPLLQEMDCYLNAGLLFPRSRRFEKFTASYISNTVKKGCAAPRHDFFDVCEKFAAQHSTAAAVFDQHLLFLKRTLFDYAGSELKSKKHEQNIRSFDDLLEDMQCALKRENGALAGSIRHKYQAALIDEFQDTDPVQYDIFKTIFASGDHSLFMIGDPKQAIYSFRGADIYTYMKAAACVKADYGFTLTTNWRSDPCLITAVNTILSRAGKAPFVFEQIQFNTIAPADCKKQDSLNLSGTAEAALHIWFIDREYADREDGTITKGSAEQLVARATAAEIVRLAVLGQQGKAKLGDRDLCPGDIAVLVRKNRQARMIQQELELLSMPSVLYGAESVFDSHEAEEVARVTAAVAEPGNEKKIKAALATDMLGLSGNDLYALADDEASWEKRLIAFHEYHEQWAQQGFIRMFRRLIHAEGVRRRLLSYRDGERRMTNLLHCAEILHRAESEQTLGMEGLVQWLSEKRSNDAAADEDQLRLETDDNAVKLITIHRSKGLEYPVVFCPFAWDGATIKDDQFSFHDPSRDDRLTLDLGSGVEENRVCAAAEALAENVRLLYVALTRAKHRCYLAWGKINEAETAAPAYLFHQPVAFGSGDIVAELGNRVKKLSYEEMLGEVTALQNATGSIAVCRLPALPREPYVPRDISPDVLASRAFTGSIEKDWKITSYSSLISAQSYRADQPDYDRVYDITIEPQRAPERTDIFSFPRGAQAGSCIHEMFEQIDFSLTDEAKGRQTIADSLGRYGFELRWQDTLWDMVREVLCMPLEENQPDFTLRNISMQERLHELEFYFPLSRITSPGIADIFVSEQKPDMATDFTHRMQELGFSPVRGFMRGFIDLIFSSGEKYYIIDWKSNYLGGSPGDYVQDALQKAMLEHYYILQYHIYTVALHRYLSMRVAGYDYDKHFGGIYYVFVRGINSACGPEYGIYRDRPAYHLVTALSDYLDGSMGIQQHE
jgi:exodeoxyribonuclease V beta subunit